ncbi:glycerophosphodiester phosphodiesterase family protein [Roseitranquillus sediminis]|uniref:glycerophosphodiester phosphodiesterase family protein n=1 Tax=Roseitranquillus sediminis TaxID=2809051 RepID=UPI001D0C5A53|nr:glycerophosphodiester phosphodiesterase family protein [Roseitranquillus sediminis]MBM9595802.1 hypothetical protein [Roseitranquillus sediminis]
MAHYAFLDHARPLAFAHRGASEESEENTLAAFREAAHLGFRYIETDVQASLDGVPVIFHDDALERMTGERGRIGDLPWRILSRLRTRAGEPLLRLDEALDALPEIRFNIDAKSDASVTPIAEAVQRAGAVERICVASFDVHRTLRLRRLLGEKLCWSPSHRGVARLWLARWLPVRIPSFPVVQVPTHFHRIPIVTPRFVEAAHGRGIQVHVWTIDEPAEMERLLDMGIDGLMTDRPRLLRDVLRRRGEWTAG